MELQEGEKEVIIKNVGEILGQFNPVQENLVPILQETQERMGYIPDMAMEMIATAMGLPPVDVYGPATFYNQFRLVPPGKYQFKVCMGTACYMAGGQIALDSFERRLNIKEGETTPDREFGLEHVTCVGCCTLAPVVMVGDQVEGHVTPTRVDGILLGYDAITDKKESGEIEESNKNREEM